jgi:coproporphyrinogen III oxidase
MTLEKLNIELAELYEKQADLANRLDLENAAIEDLNAAIADDLINDNEDIAAKTEEQHTRRTKINGLIEAAKIIDDQILQKKKEIKQVEKADTAEQLQAIHEQAERAAAELAAGFEQAAEKAYTLIKLRKQARQVGGAFSNYENEQLTLGMPDIARHALKGLERTKQYHRPAGKMHAELWQKIKRAI